MLRGLSLSSVDDWLREVSSPEEVEHAMGLATTFYPMHRVEKVILDEPCGPARSISGRFNDLTGLDLKEHVLESIEPSSS